MIHLERLCLEQQDALENQQRLIGDLLRELLTFRALSIEESRLLEAAEKGDADA